MARKAEVKVRIIGDSKSAEKAAKRSESAFKRLGNTIKRNLAASMIGATAAVYALVRAFKAVIGAASAQEDAVRALDAALLPLGENAAKVSKSLQEQAAALQKVTKHGDEVIIQGQALVASFIKDEQAIKSATQAALDLSATVGMDLNAAFLLMGKAAAGDTATLSRYGIILDEGIPKSERFAAVVKLIGEQMGGRAQEAAKTFSGRIAQLGNALGDVAERIGESATKNAELADAIGKTTDFVQKHEAAIARLWTTIGAGAVQILGGLIDKFTQLGKAIGVVTTEVMKVAGAFDTVEISESALAATAERLGVSVEEVRRRMEAASRGIHEVNTESDAAADSVENLGKKIAGAGDEALAATDHFKDATEAAVGLGNALGEVTSIELSLEITKINEALLESKVRLGENSDEYIRLERIAAEKIQRLRDRIQNLRDGLGDLKTATKESGDQWTDYAADVERAAGAVDRLTVSTRTQTQAMQEQARSGILGESYFAQIGGGTFTYAAPTVTVDPDGRLRPV